MGHNKTMRIVGIVFSLVPVIIIIIFASIYISNSKKIDEYDEVTGFISIITTETERDSDGDTRVSHTAYVTYIYEGQSYEDIRLSTYTSDMHKGDRISIYVNPDDPYDITVEMSKVFLIIPIIFTVIFGTLGIVMLVMSRGGGGKSDLTQMGIAVEAFVTYSGRANVTVNNAPTYILRAEYTDANGVLRKVKTPLLDFDPSPYVYQNGGKIMVYVDPKKPSKYYIDTAAMANVMYQPQQGYNPNVYAPNGYNPNAYNPNAYNPNAYNPNGYNPNGYNPNGYNPNGYNPNVNNQNGYNPNAYNPNGYNPNVNNPNGYNPNGYNPDGTPRNQ